MGWLAPALDFVFPPRKDELIVRAARADALAARLSPELIETTRPHTVALFSFDAEVPRALIREAKYHASRKAQALLGAALADYLVEYETDIRGTCVLIPMPLSRARFQERGFNQCERIAQAAIDSGRISLTIDATLLTRVKNTEHQTRLSRKERQLNVAGAFCATRACDPALTYLLLDDVVTTGATIQAAASALRAAGAKRVMPLALAR